MNNILVCSAGRRVSLIKALKEVLDYVKDRFSFLDGAIGCLTLQVFSNKLNPSRLLDYLYFDLFIVSNTDIKIDITDFINKENVGKCFYGIQGLDKMISEIKKIKDNPTYFKSFSQNSNKSLLNNFNIDVSFELINNKMYK